MKKLKAQENCWLFNHKQFVTGIDLCNDSDESLWVEVTNEWKEAWEREHPEPEVTEAEVVE